MRIALFVHCFFPRYFYGTETYTFELAKNLKQLGHDPIVITAVFPGEPPQMEKVSHYNFGGIPVWSIDKNVLPNTRVKDTYYQETMAPVLRDIIQSLHPDIAHVTHLINHTAVLLEVLESESIKTVATFTDFFGFCYTNRLEAADGSLCKGPNARRTNCLACHLKAGILSKTSNRMLRNLLSLGYGATSAARLIYTLHKAPVIRSKPMADIVQDIVQRPQILASRYKQYQTVITPTRFLKNEYRRNGFLNQMKDIHFGVDIHRRPKPIRSINKPLTLGFIGQLLPHKGPDLLIKAAARSLKKGSYEIKLYGSQTLDSSFMNQLRMLSKNLAVRFMGIFPKEKMRKILDDFDILVIPSRWYENSPLVLLNALASHTPVVVSDVEGMTEFVRDGINGFVFPRNNVNGLAAVLSRISRSRGRLSKLSESTVYDMTTRSMTEKTLKVYDNVLAM